MALRVLLRRTERGDKSQPLPLKASPLSKYQPFSVNPADLAYHLARRESNIRSGRMGQSAGALSTQGQILLVVSAYSEGRADYRQGN